MSTPPLSPSSISGSRVFYPPSPAPAASAPAMDCADAVVQPLLDFQETGLFARIVTVVTMTLITLVLCLSVVGLPLFFLLYASFIRLTEPKTNSPQLEHSPVTIDVQTDRYIPELTEAQMHAQPAFVRLSRPLQAEVADLGSQVERMKAQSAQTQKVAQEQIQTLRQQLQANEKAMNDANAAKDAALKTAQATATANSLLQKQLTAAQAKPAKPASADEARLVNALAGLSGLVPEQASASGGAAPKPIVTTVSEGIVFVNRLKAHVHGLRMSLQKSVAAEQNAKATSAANTDRDSKTIAERDATITRLQQQLAPKGSTPFVDWQGQCIALQKEHDAVQAELTELRAEHDAHLKAQHKRSKSIEALAGEARAIVNGTPKGKGTPSNSFTYQATTTTAVERERERVAAAPGPQNLSGQPLLTLPAAASPVPHHLPQQP